MTGASSGIGRSTAESFAPKGARVVGAARWPDELASLVAEIEARGGEATAVRADVSQSRDVQHMVDHAIEAFGRLDFAVDDAGIDGPLAEITEVAEEDWDLVLDTASTSLTVRDEDVEAGLIGITASVAADAEG